MANIRVLNCHINFPEGFNIWNLLFVLLGSYGVTNVLELRNKAHILERESGFICNDSDSTVVRYITISSLCDNV